MLKGVVTTALALGFFTLSASPATADGPSYVEEAVQGLQGDNYIYVSTAAHSVSSSTLDSLESAAEAADIGIAILPAEAADETGGSVNEFMRQVAQGTDHGTVVVVIGRDLEAGSRVLQQGQAGQFANDAEHNYSSTDEALTQFVSSVVAAESAGTPQGSDGFGSSSDGGFPLVPIGGFAILAAAIAAGVALFINKLKQRAADKREREENKQGLPSELEPIVANIRQIVGDMDDPDLQGIVLSSLETTGRLFWRLRFQKSNRIQEMTSAYEEHLKNVYAVIQFYLDVQQFPQDHNRPDDAIADTVTSMNSYAIGVQQNMKELTSGDYTAFRVNTRMIESTVRDDTPILKTEKERDERRNH